MSEALLPTFREHSSYDQAAWSTLTLSAIARQYGTVHTGHGKTWNVILESGKWNLESSK